MLCFSSDKCLRRDLSYHNDCGVRKWKEQGFYIPELEIYKFSFTFYLLNGVCYQHQLQTPTSLHPYTAVVPSHSCTSLKEQGRYLCGVPVSVFLWMETGQPRPHPAGGKFMETINQHQLPLATNNKSAPFGHGDRECVVITASMLSRGVLALRRLHL